MTRYFMDGSGLPSNPWLDMHKAGMDLWASRQPGGITPSLSSGGDLSRAEAREIIENTRADPETSRAWVDPKHPKHEEVSLKMGWMHRIAYPKEAAEKIDVPTAPAAAPPGTAPSAMTAEQARVAIVGRNADKEFRDAYFKNDHPGHALAVQQMADLHRAAYPSGPEVVDAEPVALPGGFNLV